MRVRRARTPAGAASRGPVDAPPLWLLALEGRAVFEWAAWCVASPLWRAFPRGDGHPVLVLPGLMTGDHATWPLRSFLSGLGYAAHRWDQGMNCGPSEQLLQRLLRRMRALRRRHRRPVSLVGWSLGGLYARALAAHAPRDVRGIVTLGSPLTAEPDATNVRRVFEWVSGRAADDPELQRLLGGHPAVPVTSILSRSDGVVHWRASLLPPRERAESIEVPASHLGMGANPLVLWLIADRLAQSPRRWRPFDCSSGWRSLAFRGAPPLAGDRLQP